MTKEGHQIRSNSACEAENKDAIGNKKKKPQKKQENPVHHLWWQQ